MLTVDAATLDRLFTFDRLIDVIAEGFRAGMTVPPRHAHVIGAGPSAAAHLLMPAWTADAPAPGSFLGCKLINVFPRNNEKGMPAVLGTYVLMSGETGAPLAVIDGTQLTLWRTAAASALAASHLARATPQTMAMVGAGALAPFLIRAHRTVRPSLNRVLLWNHRPAKAEALAAELAAAGLPVEPVTDLRAAVREADLVSCATLSHDPVVHGADLKPGAHLDLVGAFDLAHREADDEALRRGRLFVDGPKAIKEGGDVAIAIRHGAIAEDHVVGTLEDLVRHRVPGRTGEGVITVFKSCGHAVEDLAAAMLVWRAVGTGGGGAP